MPCRGDPIHGKQPAKNCRMVADYKQNGALGAPGGPEEHLMKKREYTQILSRFSKPVFGDFWQFWLGFLYELARSACILPFACIPALPLVFIHFLELRTAGLILSFFFQGSPGKDSRSQWGAPPPTPPQRSPPRGALRALFGPIAKERWFEALPGGPGESQDRGKEAQEGFHRLRGGGPIFSKAVLGLFSLIVAFPGLPGTASNHLKMSSAI